MRVVFEDLYGRINLHGQWSVTDLEESHKFRTGPFTHNCGDESFRYWLYLEVCDMDSCCGRDNEGQPRWNVELCAVAPDCVKAGEVVAALRCCGDEHRASEMSDEDISYCLESYGTKAHIHGENGRSLRPMVRRAIAEAREAAADISPYLSRPQNKIGTTAMEALSGDLLAPIRRQQDDPHIQLVQRMHGMTMASLAQANGVVQIKQSDIKACPHYIMMPEHYWTSGACRCNDPYHKEMEAWGYEWRGGEWAVPAPRFTVSTARYCTCETCDENSTRLIEMPDEETFESSREAIAWFRGAVEAEMVDSEGATPCLLGFPPFLDQKWIHASGPNGEYNHDAPVAVHISLKFNFNKVSALTRSRIARVLRAVDQGLW